MSFRILILLLFLGSLNTVLSQVLLQDIVLSESKLSFNKKKSFKNFKYYNIKANVMLQVNESYGGRKNKFKKKKARYEILIVKDSLGVIEDSCYRVINEYWKQLNIESNLYKFDKNMSNVAVFKSFFILNDTVNIPYIRDSSGGVGSRSMFYYKNHLYIVKLIKSYPGFGGLDSFTHSNIYISQPYEKLGCLKFVKHIDEAIFILSKYYKR